jgi:hypothetical protein
MMPVFNRRRLILNNLFLFAFLGSAIISIPASADQFSADSQEVCSKAQIEGNAYKLILQPEEKTNSIPIIACSIDSDPENFECMDTGHDKLFLYKKVSLKNNSDRDLFVKDFRCCRGDNNIFLILIFAHCKNDIYVKIGEGMFTEMNVEINNSKKLFPDLSVTRECYNTDADKLELRKFRLQFDEKMNKYASPNGDPILDNYCEKELGMPAL